MGRSDCQSRPYASVDPSPPADALAAGSRIRRSPDSRPAHLGTVLVRHLGIRDYQPVFTAMQAFTTQRDAFQEDELWLLEHWPVFTQGINGSPTHLLNPGDIPVVQVDRGGQVTFHGPGQLVVYVLVDIKRAKLGVRALVTTLENSVIGLLAEQGIRANARTDAPGVYVNDRKIASLGLRVRSGRCYHGLSLNVDMDLKPFERINPCGHRGLLMTQLQDLRPETDKRRVAEQLLRRLIANLGFSGQHSAQELPNFCR